ncbi:MAG TPA: MFS transporter [Candidatus Dormibacteraeota bacterium]|nr:MFS transporter [Candidatus Dormibacteraeota bacterium]
MSKFRSALRNPWWIPPILGGVPDIEPRLVSLLGLVALALFFEQYDNSMLTSALKHIAEDLQMPKEELGTFLAMVKLGALPAFLIVPFADRFGRRRLFLIGVLLFSLGTVATAFTQTPMQFVLAQTVTRTFMLTASAVAFVIVTEEYPAIHRGWAIGMLGALASCGNGLGAGLFAAIDSLPYGWRSLYIVGLVPLFLVPFLRRRVPETERFTAHRAAELAHGHADGLLGGWLRPLVNLALLYPGRALGIALVGGLMAVGESAVFQFTAYFVLTVHGWSPGDFALMFIAGGGVGIIGNIVAGRIGDRVGRRIVGFVFLSFFPLFAWLFYHGPGWVLPIAWALFVFCNTAGGVIVRAFSTELFPTSYRGTSAAWLSLIQTLGWALGLELVSLVGGDIGTSTGWISMVVLVAACALLALPETYQQELETISHDQDERLIAPIVRSLP